MRSTGHAIRKVPKAGSALVTRSEVRAEVIRLCAQPVHPMSIAGGWYTSTEIARGVGCAVTTAMDHLRTMIESGELEHKVWSPYGGRRVVYRMRRDR